MHVALGEARHGDIVIRTLGAGPSLREAKARARMEMVERLSGFFTGDEPMVRAPQRALGEAAIAPNAVLLYSRRQQKELQIPYFARDATSGSFRASSASEESAVALDWSPLLDVHTGEVRYLPTRLLYYGYARRGRVRADSNGVAAGRSFADAACRALLELIERDAVALWWYNRAPRPALSLARVADSFVQRFVAWQNTEDRDCIALDLTTDLGVPVVAALSVRRSSPEEIAIGFGASLDSCMALRHALLETGQMLALIGAWKARKLALAPAMTRWLRSATTATRAHLRPLDVRPRAVRSRPPTGDAAAVFRSLARRLRRQGLETLVLDLTRPHFGTPVVRVVVPGLRPWWPRFAPGRLYDAPVSAGWLAHARTESAMNRESVFF